MGTLIAFVWVGGVFFLLAASAFLTESFSRDSWRDGLPELEKVVRNDP